MTVALDRDVAEFLNDQLKSGVCADANQLVNNLLRAVRDQQEAGIRVTPELEDWLLRAADSPVAPLRSQDFEGVRDRVQARLNPRSK